jgi:hypothetical protein
MIYNARAGSFRWYPSKTPKEKKEGKKKSRREKGAGRRLVHLCQFALSSLFFCYYCPVRSPTIAPTPKGASDSTQKNEKLKFKKKRRKRQKKKLRASRIPPLSLFLKAFTFLA